MSDFEDRHQAIGVLRHFLDSAELHNDETELLILKTLHQTLQNMMLIVIQTIKKEEEKNGR